MTGRTTSGWTPSRERDPLEDRLGDPHRPRVGLRGLCRVGRPHGFAGPPAVTDLAVPFRDPWPASATVQWGCPGEWRGASADYERLGRPGYVGRQMERYALEAVGHLRDACGIHIARVGIPCSDHRLEFYSVVRPWWDLVGNNHLSIPSGGCCRLAGTVAQAIVWRNVLDRPEPYRRALFLWLVGAAAGLGHAPPEARSIMIPGLRRQGEDFWRTRFGLHDKVTLRHLYGPPAQEADDAGDGEGTQGAQ